MASSMIYNFNEICNCYSYDSNRTQKDATYLCSKCLADSLPFHSITDVEFQKINSRRNLYCKQYLIRNDLHVNSDLFLSNNSECNYCETKQAKPYLYPTHGAKTSLTFILISEVCKRISRV